MPVVRAGSGQNSNVAAAAGSGGLAGAGSWDVAVTAATILPATLRGHTAMAWAGRCWVWGVLVPGWEQQRARVHCPGVIATPHPWGLCPRPALCRLPPGSCLSSGSLLGSTPVPAMSQASRGGTVVLGPPACSPPKPLRVLMCPAPPWAGPPAQPHPSAVPPVPTDGTPLSELSWSSSLAVVAVSFSGLFTFIFLMLACLCCKKGDIGFKVSGGHGGLPRSPAQAPSLLPGPAPAPVHNVSQLRTVLLGLSVTGGPILTHPAAGTAQPGSEGLSASASRILTHLLSWRGAWPGHAMVKGRGGPTRTPPGVGGTLTSQAQNVPRNGFSLIAGIFVEACGARGGRGVRPGGDTPACCITIPHRPEHLIVVPEGNNEPPRAPAVAI